MKGIRLILIIYLIGFSTGCRDNSKKDEENVDSQNRIVSLKDSNIPEDQQMIINCFLYHRFDENKYPSTSIHSELFEKQLKYLSENHIPVLTLGDAVSKLLSSDQPGRFAVITIDDAFKSFYEHGFPVLKKYNVKATLFVNTETIGAGDYISWEQLGTLSEYGIEIGNHTHSHAYFLNYPDSRRYEAFEDEIKLSQKLIRERLKIKPLVFSYPYGEYDSLMKQIVKDENFVCGMAQNSGVISKYSDLFSLPRFPMTDLYGSMGLFIQKATALPFPVLHIEPSSTIPSRNPPELSLTLQTGKFDWSRLQCFIQGSDCIIEKSDQATGQLILKAGSLLKNRRHLYTITAPSTTGNGWCWFSHQWIFPDKEDR